MSDAAIPHASTDAPHALLALYAALRACDAAVIRSTSAEALFDAVCERLLECPEVSFVWIGRVDALDQQVWPQAQRGRTGSAPDLMQACDPAVRLLCQDLAGQAIASGRVQAVPDTATAAHLQSFEAVLQGLQWRSAFAFPLHIGAVSIGALCVYANRAVAADGIACTLLTQLAANISHALENFEHEEQRQETLRALRESEARYSAVFASNCMAMIVIDPDSGRMMDANERAIHFYGWDRDTLLGMNIADINVLTSEEIRKEMARAAKSERSFYEFLHRRAQGDVRSVEVFTSPFELDGKIYLISAIHDVTERRELESRLRDSQLLMQRFVDHLPGTAFIKDSSLRLVMANKELGRVLGRSPQSLIGKTAYEIFPREFADFVTGLDREVLAEGGVHVFDETLGNRHNETSMFVMEDEWGQRLLGGLSFDVTERYHYSQRAAVLMNLNTLGSELSEKDFMTACLDQMERLTHSTVGFLHLVNDDQTTLELVTWSAGVLCDCDALHKTHASTDRAGVWSDAVHTRKPVITNDYAHYLAHKGLDPCNALTRLVCVPVQEGGKVRMILGVGNKDENYNDFDAETLQLLGNDVWRIVRRNRAEVALQQQIQELVQANQKLADMQLQLLQSEKMASIGQLAAGVAHEINNPIGFVKSNLGTLSKYIDHLVEVLNAYEAVERAGKLPAEQSGSGSPTGVDFTSVEACKQAVDYEFLLEDLKQLIVESSEGVQRISQIVADLKNFSRSGDAKREWTDIHAGIDSTINVVWNQLKYKVTLHREYGVLPPVRCIASQINQVVMNLLVNAGQAIAERGNITVRTGTQDDAVWIEVQDDGCGIPLESQKKIFEPFFTTKPVGQGTGLGLSISFGIVKHHHGSITLHSVPGEGSTFRVTLPVDAPEERAP